MSVISFKSLAAVVGLGLLTPVASQGQCANVSSTDTYDYIIIGSGAGGIPMADRLSEAGHKVLLIEKGPPSTGHWGGTMKPEWLANLTAPANPDDPPIEDPPTEDPPPDQGTNTATKMKKRADDIPHTPNTNLTRFDVPGLCNQIWADPTGAICTDVDQMAGCMLGGGTAVNAGLWWKPHPDDWDTNFNFVPADGSDDGGWNNAALVGATERVFSRIPGTVAPSMDGERYLAQGFDMLSGSLVGAGWERLEVPNEEPGKKNRTVGPSTFMYAGGERSGPLATYLVSAVGRTPGGGDGQDGGGGSLTLWMNTTVKRVVREWGHATGVEVECSGKGGFGRNGTVALTPGTGRVVVSAGAFGTAKLLFRSGIGPTDQLKVVQNSTDGPTMISSDQWIDLPVGYNLNDHVGTDVEIAHPDVVFYDYYGAWDEPIVEDTETYLANRTGPLAQAAPNIGPIFWEIITGSDGTNRHLQWQARVEGTLNTSMTITQYLGTGTKSRGRMTISKQLNTMVSTPPYLRDEHDREAVIQGITNLREALKDVANLTWITPPSNMTVEDFVDSIPATPSRRCSNHWIGTAKMGLDDGRAVDGTAVVDLNTKVYGTDNIFVVDASIFPGHITGNPSAMIVIAAEHAAERILALSVEDAREGVDEGPGDA
ncbi:cellobiose dehydrogenase [Dichotomopilus funicola]|uniref:Cellobiose dehydrogenase n=1 Tax=Dichotomopilus funicola TaxID=1934379 RepID=A0AAN6ZIX4_9PEZI|nr:cellobiose dehydrogenase [Dichotomopilus funicola]